MAGYRHFADPAQPINRVATLGSEVIAGNAGSLSGSGFIYLSPDEGATAKKDSSQFQYVLETESVLLPG